MAWLEAAPLNSLKPNSAMKAEVGGVPLALYRLEDGAVYATHGVCTHALAFLADGYVSNGTIECPLHQGVFDVRSGKALCAPLTEDVRTFLVKVENGTVYVDLDRPAEVSASPTMKAANEPQQSSVTKVVIIGAGQAAAAAVRTLRASGFAGQIALVGEEKHLPYERPPLSKDVLLGKSDFSTCLRLREHESVALGVDLHLARRALKVDAATRTVELDDGTKLPYEALLIATGGTPRRLEIAGTDLGGVHYLRTIEDALAINKSLTEAKRIAIVGGGFIGLEIASAAAALGVSAVVLEREPEIMTRILPGALGRAFRRLAESKGIQIETATVADAITRDDEGLIVSTSRGSVRADAVVIGVGLQANTEVAAAAGCRVEAGGIVTDAEGRTSIPGIWAAGDCALHHAPLRGRARRLESWQNAEDQGAIAARSIAGTAAAALRAHPWFWTDQFDLNIQILGLPGADDRVYRTGPDAEASTVYRTADPQTGRLTGIIAFSNASAIRAGRAELLNPAAFEPALVNAIDVTDTGERGAEKQEHAIMLHEKALAAKTQYIWPANGVTRIPDWVYTDQTIYEREVERIFHGRTWNYVALEA
ncbi:MAG: FAD-dependent oxidoreductase, partial [Methylobacteriaceae bacterium]|nr:FAD-dependent oxidoreductase [Methylobacteriaceae bacterium]